MGGWTLGFELRAWAQNTATKTNTARPLKRVAVKELT